MSVQKRRAHWRDLSSLGFRHVPDEYRMEQPVPIFGQFYRRYGSDRYEDYCKDVSKTVSGSSAHSGEKGTAMMNGPGNVAGKTTVVVRNAMDKLMLPSLSFHRTMRSKPLSSLENLVGPADRVWEDQGKACSDEFWINNLHDLAAKNWYVDGWVKAVNVEDGVEFVYGEEYDLVGGENYSSEVLYGLTPFDYASLLTGLDTDTVMFFRAEGQLARIVLNTPDHPTRLVAFKMWLALMGRFCGGQVCHTGSRALQRMDSYNIHWESCSMQRNVGMFTSYNKYATSMLLMSSVWLYTIRSMNDLREKHLGSWCFDHDQCALHGFECLGVAELAELDWDETRENTPDPEHDFTVVN